MSNTDTRFCLMDTELDGFEIAIETDRNILAFADFKIYANDTKEVLESFRLTAENGRRGKKKLSLNQQQLNKNIMSWSVVCCAKDPKIFGGELTMLVLQQSRICKLSVPISYKFANVPPCSSNDFEKINGSLVFILKNQVELPM